MAMKKFIRKIILLVLSIFIIGNLIMFVLFKVSPKYFIAYLPEYIMWQHQRSMIDTKHNGPINVIIGDSRTMAAFDPTLLGSNWYNYALGGTTPFEGYMVFKGLIVNNKIDTLIVCYAPTHLARASSTKFRTFPFRFIQSSDISSLNAIEHKLNTTIYSESPNIYTSIEKYLYYYHYPMLFRQGFVENFLINLKDAHKVADIVKFMKQHRGQSMFGRADSAKNPTSDTLLAQNYEPNKVLVSYYDSIITTANHLNAKVFVSVSPYSYLSRPKIDGSRMLIKYNRLLDSLAGKYTNVSKIRSEVFLPNNCFGDDSHVNTRGAKYFTISIKQALGKK